MSRSSYADEGLRHLVMPLGGIGTGQVGIAGDGALRQWQTLGRPNHTASVPDSLFAIRANRYHSPLDLVRILQSEEALTLERGTTPLVNDDFVPSWQQDAVARFGGVDRTVASGLYPRLEIEFIDDELPVSVTLKAWSPLVPLDAGESSLPVGIFDFTVRNPGLPEAETISGCVAAGIQNAIGWDGWTPITGNRCPLFGSNTNKLRRSDGLTSILMENVSLPESDPLFGQMMIAAPGELVVPFERWTNIEEFVAFLEGVGFSRERPWSTTSEYLAQRMRGPMPAVPHGPSQPGETWNGALAVPFALAPGEATTITFVLAWFFPNRIVDFDQFAHDHGYGKSVFWIGNAYAERFRDVEAVVDHVIASRADLAAVTDSWVNCLDQSTLPDSVAASIAGQVATIRSPTCFQTADGRFFGFEGSLGASTTHWSGAWGGSCALNCSHVWNYEQTLSRLFPALERTMRETELEVAQAPAGYIPHRITLPLFVPQLWGVPSWGPVEPALDGMLGVPLKVYRELRQGAGTDWLPRLWPSVTLLMKYVVEYWDPDESGVIRGEQPNTFDIAFRGANTYIGSLWLAALRAMEELSSLQGDDAWRLRARKLFELGHDRYDALLFNGDYYEQEPHGSDEHQYVSGCLTDQLIGQWWAHQLGLGYVLPAEHVRTALQSVFRFNFRPDFSNFDHRLRRFADGADGGLLVCTWPRGGRPAVPVEYCDETWTGSEYAFAALCLSERLEDEALTVLGAIGARYDGERRNPFNEIECGDHYARSLSGWSIVEALGGWRFNALADELEISTPVASHDARTPFVVGTGWGTIELQREGDELILTISCAWGRIFCSRLLLDGVTVMVEPIDLTPGQSLELHLGTGLDSTDEGARTQTGVGRTPE